MEHLDILATAIGALVLALGLASRKLERSPFPPTLLALVFGVLLGPQVSGFVDLAELGERSRILEGAARLTLAIGLVGVALGIPREFVRRNWRDMAVLIGGSMPLMWCISTLLVFWLLALPFWLAALIAAIVTATDPIASTPIVTGALAEKDVPEGIRHAILFESGANDGLAYVFVFLPFLLVTRPAGEAWSHWLTHTVLLEVGGATLLGVVLGYAAGKLLRFAEQRSLIGRDWRLVYTVAMALLAVGAGRLIGSDELLVVFAAGIAFVQVVSSSERCNEEAGQEAVNRFFSVPVFALVGIAIPWDGWMKLGWTGVLLALALLLLRRIPALLLLRPFLKAGHRTADALFMGWFGPIAVAAVYYAALMEDKLSEPLIWDITSLVVCASVVVHGLTGSPFTRWYGRHSPGR
jgi:NhaP-type Na+/H+ or K+/H+ antiporter